MQSFMLSHIAYYYSMIFSVPIMVPKWGYALLNDALYLTSTANPYVVYYDNFGHIL